MSDKDTFVSLMKKAGATVAVTGPASHLQCNPLTTHVVWVNGGYRSHVEAEFDVDGKILSLGSFWDDNEMPEEKS